MNVLYLFSETFLHALLWMLVHSIWQALMAAALAGVVIVCTRRQSAAMRYNLLVLVYCLFLVAVGCTFQLYYQGPYTIGSFQSPATGIDNITFTTVYTKGAAGAAWLLYGIQWINQHATTLILLWLTAASVKGLILLRNYRQVTVLRSRNLEPVEPFWHNKLVELCAMLGINRTVGFFQTRLAKVPMVVGCLKPMVLVPVGFFNGLPPAEVEAILVHELAHIRRNDYLVNLLQNLVELVFFFNLPLLWLSGQIRKEREHCCDDMAVAYSGNKRGYINALVAFQEQGGANVCAAAFSGKKKMPLLERVKRLIYNHNQTLNSMEKISLFTGVLAVSVIAFAFNSKSNNKILNQLPSVDSTPAEAVVPPVPPAKRKTVVLVDADAVDQSRLLPAKPYGAVAADTTGKDKHEVNTIINGKRYQMTLVNDKLTALSIDGVPVPESRFHEYNDVVKTILEHKAKAEEHAKAAQEHAKRAEEMAVVANEHARRAEVFSKEAVAHAADATARSREAENRTKDAEVRAKEAQQHEARAKEHIRLAEEHAKRAEEHAVRAEVHAKEAQVHAKVYEHLVKEGVLKKGEMNTNINIKDGKLIVNGVEQPNEVYERYQKLVQEERKRLGLR